jgi:hypothetical protein
MSADLFNKLMALAWDASATDGEAISAFLKAKRLRLRNPKVSEQEPEKPKEPEPSFEYHEGFMWVPVFWSHQILPALAEAAFSYGLKCRFEYEAHDDHAWFLRFDVFCEGSENNCATMGEYVADYFIPALTEQLNDNKNAWQLFERKLKLPDPVIVWIGRMVRAAQEFSAQES